jgi:hypothetical protein
MKLDYDEIIDTHKNILPVPFPANPAPSSPEGIPYGKTKRPMPLQPYPNSKYDKTQYCNELPPAPRSQDLNVPYQGPECPFYNDLPFKKDACYLTTNNGQGVVGLVCNSAGGSDNANFARGNQFGLNYERTQSDQFKKKKTIYDTNPPVQLTKELQNPLVIFDKNTFYPQPDWALQKNPNTQTYMHPNQFTPHGLPTYTYPYEVINPMKSLSSKEYQEKMQKRESSNDPVISDYPNNVPYTDFNPSITQENFEDVDSKNLSIVPSSSNDPQSMEGFQNMMCPHRGGCGYCRKCPFGPQCRCGRNCPYCMNCPTHKRTILDNFKNNMIEQFENENTSKLYRFSAIILLIILLILLIPYLNKFLKK